MKVTYNWLKTYAEFDLSPDDLVQTLTMLGFEVDAVDALSWDFDGVVVGRVTRKVRHQNAEKLWVCDVDIGTEHLSVVCGAPNVQVGQKVPVAKAGTRLPDGRVIESATIRGVRSEGMICSEAELGISSRGQGIMVLDDDVEFGKRLQDALGRGDVVLDIDVTPNRPDCFGVIGIAREIAAACGTKLRKPDIRLKETQAQTSDYIRVNIIDAQKCPRYTARYISGVKIGPSPWRLAHRLEAVGIRSINNVVDVTNYVMMETGQPLHAFDYDLLAGGEINVKCAAEGERFTTLDGVVRTLNSECLLICDARQPVAIGGVMGGENSEVTEKTANVLLESAYFDPTNIRRTAKALGIVTEASRRFERGVDPNGAPYALHRAAQLIAELTGGTVSSGFVDAYPSRIENARVTLRPQP
ncbi:MAG: phenylalanine--tRNA ligase subunit beta, partial [Calditrichaeota bacterium]